jgi:hypothetical protein
VREVAVQYYIDADTLGLAHILASIRPDVTYPGDVGGIIRKRHRPPCPITSTDVPDDEWIPVVADRGWTIITRARRSDGVQLGAAQRDRDLRRPGPKSNVARLNEQR